MSKDVKLKTFLEKIHLEKYYEAFLEEDVSYHDLEFLETDDVEKVIPKKFHRNRFFVNVEALKSARKTNEERSNTGKTPKKVESGSGEKEEVLVQMLVKLKDEVRKIYDVPANTSNEEMLFKLLEEFVGLELTLPDKTVLTSRRKLTLEKWMEKKSVNPDSEIRGVLSLKGSVLEGGNKEVEGLRSENEELKTEKADLEKSLKSVERSRKEAEKLLERSQNGKKEVEKMLKLAQKKTQKLLNVEVSKRNQLERDNDQLRKEIKGMQKKLMERSTRAFPSRAIPATSGFKVLRGIHVPQNVCFQVGGEIERGVLFKEGNRKATCKQGGRYLTFKASTIFTSGKTYYFQVSANVVLGGGMYFGVLHGDLNIGKFVGEDHHGWGFCCYPSCQYTYHRNQLYPYGPNRTKGKHVYGIFCDFTNGKGEVSFIVDGKNHGIAFKHPKNVRPPVSPAFTLYYKGDSFQIEECSKLPSCV